MANNNNTECFNFTATTSTALPAIYSVMFLPSISGNIISLVIFQRLQRKTSTHIYLINLAVSNVMVSTSMPFQIMYYSQAQYWSYNSLPCSIIYQVASLLTHCSMCVSITIFSWIAVSRYATLLRPTKSTTTYEKIIFGNILKAFRNPKFALFLCVGVWLFFLCLNLTCFLLKQEVAPDKKCFDKEVEIFQHIYKITSVVESTCFFIFLLVVLLFYHLFIKHIQELQANSCIGEKHLVYSRVKNNIIIVVAILLLCFMPYHLTKYILVAYDYSFSCQKLSVLLEVKNCCLCLAEFRSCTDPIVYLFLDNAFKKNFLLFCKKCSKDEEFSTSTANNQSTATPTVSGRITRSIVTNEQSLPFKV